MPVEALRRPARCDRAALLDWVDAALADLVRHAGTRVAHYRRHFEAAGLDPGSVHGRADLARLPFTTKADLQALPLAERLVDGARVDRLVRLVTSGSTGEPLFIFRTPAERRRLGALRLAVLRTYGLRRRDRLAILSWLPPSERARRGPLFRMLQALGFHRFRMIDPLQTPERILEELRAFRPDVIGGLTSAVLAVSRLGEGSGLAEIRPRLVATGGEMLTPWTRQQIGAGLGAVVRDTYGSYEMQLMASECPETGLMHICEPGVVLEILDETDAPVPEGGRGEIVATSLGSRTMPFLRYRTGDVAVRGPSPCSCGSPLATLRALEGRVTDTFRLPEGRTLHPYRLLIGVERVAGTWVRQAQLLQERVDRVRVRVVPRAAVPSDGTARIRDMASEELGPGVEACVDVVDVLYPARSGKFRAFRSLVDPVPDVPLPDR